jgi:hypothetical protein
LKVRLLKVPMHWGDSLETPNTTSRREMIGFPSYLGSHRLRQLRLFTLVVGLKRAPRKRRATQFVISKIQDLVGIGESTRALRECA